MARKGTSLGWEFKGVGRNEKENQKEMAEETLTEKPHKLSGKKRYYYMENLEELEEAKKKAQNKNG